MNKDLFLEILSWVAQATKHETCEENNGPCDLPYMVSVLFSDQQIETGVTTSRQGVIKAFRAIVDQSEVDEVACLALIADSFYQNMADDEVVPKAGELMLRFESGDFTVGEALVVTVIDMEKNESKAVQIPYKYDDWGHPEFDKPRAYNHDRLIVIDGMFEGRMVIDGKSVEVED